MIRVIVLALAVLLANTTLSRAETYLPMPSTPDISITGSATAEYIFDLTAGPADWVGIKNDCKFPIWFTLTPGRYPDSRQFNIRLDGLVDSAENVSRAGQSFSGAFRTYSIGASGDGANNCTFTLQLGKKVR
tara:strand:+ start:871 stop:1266 length:396 start_codon:yes stop_codon:yes gene_type:complete